MTFRQTCSEFARKYGCRKAAMFILPALAITVPADDRTIADARDPSTPPPVAVTATGPAGAPTTQPAVVDFQPGVRIDWQRRQVLVEGEIVLRRGALELFACSPQTREHESIVRVNARPFHVFQALGLIGLEPGKPSHYTDDMQTYHPATGAPVAIDVLYTRQGRKIQHPIEEWMQHADAGKPLDQQPWVFAGSYARDNTYAADPEGTIIAVVDFPSAIIALPRYHSASDEELWLEPATDRIPPVGVGCTLIFKPGAIRMRIDRQGRYFLQQQPALLHEIIETLKRDAAEDHLHPLRLEIDPDAPPSRVRALRDVIDLLDVPIEDTTTQPAQQEEPEHESRLVVPWIKDMLATMNTALNAPSTRPAPAGAPGPPEEPVWIATSAQVAEVASGGFVNRYRPYVSSKSSGTAASPNSEPQGD